ncbi:MAG: site-specific DNA-methyltransferase [Acidimicrobiia bacterium]|nr:MAG: site-specific DNA-methyltransferase [Acidimicrobiia bacterium]
MTDVQPYVTDEANGEAWRLMLGDSCERLSELPDESIDLAVYSPPFASLYTYSPSDRDLGNASSADEFAEHYRFILNEVLRVMKPGRVIAVHCQQIATQKWRDGVVGLSDFRGDLIRAHQDAGYTFYGEVTIWKNPQAQQIVKKVAVLSFTQLERDSASSRPALGDYLLIFRKPGDNAVPVDPECTRDEWTDWAAPIWTTGQGPFDAIDAGPFGSCWFDIKETNTLNTAVAKENGDERHICPLQLDLIERVLRLWSNRGELVLSPFAGIGSEGVVAVETGRRFVGCELKPSYWQTAVRNLRAAEHRANAETLFGAS